MRQLEELHRTRLVSMKGRASAQPRYAAAVRDVLAQLRAAEAQRSALGHQIAMMPVAAAQWRARELTLAGPVGSPSPTSQRRSVPPKRKPPLPLYAVFSKGASEGALMTGYLSSVSHPLHPRDRKLALDAHRRLRRAF